VKHTFKISTGLRSKIVSVEGTKEYAMSYVAGYIQAMRDKMPMGELLVVDVKDVKDKS
jgi:hypothetical protein